MKKYLNIHFEEADGCVFIFDEYNDKELGQIMTLANSGKLVFEAGRYLNTEQLSDISHLLKSLSKQSTAKDGGRLIDPKVNFNNL